MIYLLLCYGLIGWLLRRDMRWRRVGSLSLLVPGAWIAVQGSRPVAYWFGSAGGSESNPITTIWFATLLIAATFILLNRRVNWGGILRTNKALFLLYGYFMLSVLWSELPVVSAKRIVKDFGCVLVGLIFLTEKNPADAIRIVFVRVSYILFPLSIVFIKYFPSIGRQANRAGENMFTGVTTQKNSLGQTVFVFSLFLLWDLVEIYKGKNSKEKRMQLGIRIALLLMGAWLLVMCDSKTSLLCLLLGVVIYWGSNRLLRMANGKRWLIIILASSISLIALDKTFGISDAVIRALGRDPSLTGRTEIWRLVMEQQTSQMLGHGFCIFWDTDAGWSVIETLMRINSAHNGYLETYVDGGLVGVTLLGLFLLVGGFKIINAMFAGNRLAQIGLVFWILALIYNLSESSFFRLDILWFVLILVMLGSTKIYQSKPSRNRPQFPS